MKGSHKAKSKQIISPFAFFAGLATTFNGKARSSTDNARAGEKQSNSRKAPLRNASHAKQGAKQHSQTQTRQGARPTGRVSKLKGKRPTFVGTKAPGRKTGTKSRTLKKNAVKKRDEYVDKPMSSHDSPDSSEREVLLLAERARRVAEKKRQERKKMLQAKDASIVQDMQRIAGTHSTKITELGVADANAVKKASSKTERALKAMGQRAAKIQTAFDYLEDHPLQMEEAKEGMSSLDAMIKADQVKHDDVTRHSKKEHSRITDVKTAEKADHDAILDILRQVDKIANANTKTN